MARLRMAVGVAVVAALAGMATADPEAVEHLQAAQQALRDARSLSYTISIRTEGGWASLSTDGKVTMRRKDDHPTAWLVRRQGKATMPGIDPIEFLVANDDRTTQWIDHDKKTLFERYTSSAKDKQVTVAGNAWVRQLAEPQPFAKEIAAPTTTVEGAAEIDGVQCVIIFADQGQDKEKARWWLGAADHIPRKYEWILSSGGFSSKTVYTMSNVQLNPEVDPSTFTLEAPAGYTEERLPPPRPMEPELLEQFSNQAVGPMVLPPKIMQAPEFELTGPDGAKVSLTALRGNVVVLDFWGTWCFPCKKSTPEVQKLHEHFKDQKVKVLGVAVREKSHDEPVRFFKENNLTYQLLLDGDQVAKDFRVTKYPSFVVVGFEGEVLTYKESFKPNDTFAEITQDIQNYLDSGGKVRPQNFAPQGPDDGVAAGGDVTTSGGATTTTTRPKDDDGGGK